MKSFYILIIIPLCYGCIKKNKELNSSELYYESYQIPTDLNANDIEKRNLSGLYSKISGFSLDPEGGKIGMVDKVLVFDHKIFVLDSEFAKRLFVYDLRQNGKFLFSVGTRGKGPGEFLHFTDFTIDSMKNQILTIDMIQKQVSYFDLKGTFISSSKLGFSPRSIFADNNYLYFYARAHSEDDFGLKIMDKDLKTKKEYLQFKSYPILSFHNSIFLQTGDKMLLNYPNCDTIFQIKDLVINPYLVLDSESYSFSLFAKSINLTPSNRINQNINIRKNKYNALKNVILPEKYFEDDKIKLFSFFKDRRHLELIVDKSKHDTNLTYGRLYNDFFLSPISFYGYDKNYGTFGVVETESMLSAQMDWIHDHEESISKQLIQSIYQIDPDDNPFIIFLK